MDLMEQLETRGIGFRENKSRENEVLLCCPFCMEEGTSEDTRFRLSINTQTLWMNCFNCGKKSKSKDYTEQELARVLNTGELDRAQRRTKKRTKKTYRLPDDFRLVVPQKKTNHWNEVAWKYLQMRNISQRMIREKQIGFCLAGEMRYRIVLPVYYRGELRGLVGRAFVRDLEPKYKNSIGEKVLYNVPDVVRWTAVLTEGAFDALSVERVIRSKYVKGHRADSLAVLGHSLTDLQMEILDQYREIVCWPDPDKAGLIGDHKTTVGGFMKMGRQLQERGKKVWMVIPEENKTEYDPSELFPREIEKKLDGVVEYTKGLEDRIRVRFAFQED